MAPRFALARRKARELVAAANIKSAPIPVEKLAERVGAVIRLEPFKGELSGMAHRRPDGTAVIGVNSIHSVSRRRFTIAHEIGHLVLHQDKDLHIDEKFPVHFRSERSSLGLDAMEVEANQFASELLMPEHLLAKDLGDGPFDVETDDRLNDLAHRYGVSLQAMTLRLSRWRTT